MKFVHQSTWGPWALDPIHLNSRKIRPCPWLFVLILNKLCGHCTQNVHIIYVALRNLLENITRGEFDTFKSGPHEIRMPKLRSQAKRCMDSFQSLATVSERKKNKSPLVGAVKPEATSVNPNIRHVFLVRVWYNIRLKVNNKELLYRVYILKTNGW